MQEKRLIEHLEDLRACVFKSLIGVVVTFAVSLLFVSHTFKLLSKPYRDCLFKMGISGEPALRSLGPADTLQITLSASLILGIGLASPWIAYQVWRFISPALHKHEIKYAVVFCSSSVVFFLAGVSFAYLVVLPNALSFFYTYTKGLGITPDWAIASYYEFVVSFLAGFGLVFELPVAIVILTLLGITTPKGLRTYRRHAVIIIFILAGFFTPGPDIASQLMMGVPMLLLYELAILASGLVWRNRNVGLAPRRETRDTSHGTKQ